MNNEHDIITVGKVTEILEQTSRPSGEKQLIIIVDKDKAWSDTDPLTQGALDRKDKLNVVIKATNAELYGVAQSLAIGQNIYAKGRSEIDAYKANSMEAIDIEATSLVSLE